MKINLDILIIKSYNNIMNEKLTKIINYAVMPIATVYGVLMTSIIFASF